MIGQLVLYFTSTYKKTHMRARARQRVNKGVRGGGAVYGGVSMAYDMKQTLRTFSKAHKVRLNTT